MQAVYHFIVSVPKKFEDSLKVGDKEIFLENKFNEFEHRISYGEIVTTPMKHPEVQCKPGDTLIFHHHVTTNPMQNIGENKHFVLYDPENGRNSQAIAYREKESGELHMLSDWLFVLPIDEREDVVTEAGIITELATKQIPPDEAEIYMPHPELEAQGVEPGDIIAFDKHSDYKIKLDNDDVVYRMRVDDIKYVKVHNS
tara:strand:+ start:2770 stop:3366 length:597 start_codon:yes stop_codon:yes gene_type:complete